MIDRVGAALDDALATAGRREIVDAALSHARMVLVRDLRHAAEVVDDLAPEHLQLLVADPDAFLATVRNAGAVFLGPWSAVPFGDYGVASNHVLPTAGTARFASGLRAADFVTVRSVVEMTPASATRLAPETSTIARSEGLVGHAAAMDARMAKGRMRDRDPTTGVAGRVAVRLAAADRDRAAEHERMSAAAPARVRRRAGGRDRDRSRSIGTPTAR